MSSRFSQIVHSTANCICRAQILFTEFRIQVQQVAYIAFIRGGWHSKPLQFHHSSLLLYFMMNHIILLRQPFQNVCCLGNCFMNDFELCIAFLDKVSYENRFVHCETASFVICDIYVTQFILHDTGSILLITIHCLQNTSLIRH